MTKYAIPASLVTDLGNLALAFAEGIEPVVDQAEPELPFEGEDQACEAFMDEREVLKNALDHYETRLRRMLAEQDQVGVVLGKIAEYATALQNRLNAIGIQYEPGEDGLPVIHVNPEVLLGALEAAFVPQAG
jgi:hypothetical protein